MSEKNIKLDLERGFKKLISLEITSKGNGVATGEIAIGDEHINPIGTVHGGVLFSLADSIGGTAASTNGRPCTTVNGSIEYMREVMNCQKIICTARVVKSGKTLVWTECEIRNEKDVLLSTAKFLYFYLDSKGE